MQRKYFLFLMLLAGVVAATGCGAAANAAVATETAPSVSAPNVAPTAVPPHGVVEMFYEWYMGYARSTGNPLVDGAYRGSPYLDAALVQAVDETLASAERALYDPFLCAQDIPAELRYAPISPGAGAETASVSVQGVWNPATEYEQVSEWQVALRRVDEAWKIVDITCQVGQVQSQPTAVPPVASPTPAYQVVDIPAMGLRFEVPGDWQRTAPELAWSPAGSEDLILGVNWIELPPPVEAEAALLPHHAQIIDAQALALSCGEGRRFTVEVYAPAAQADDEQAPVASVQAHVIVTVQQGEVRRAFDLYAVAPAAEGLASLEPALAHLLTSFQLSNLSQSAASASEQVFRLTETDGYGFQLTYPQDWTFKELETQGPGMPEDWPIERVVQFFPQAWAEALNSSGPPDPTQPPVVAPLSLEVCVGPDEAFRRAYPAPTASERVDMDGATLVIERDQLGEQIQLVRYVFQHPQDPELRIVLIDYLSGFPSRAAGNEALVALLGQMVSTMRFVE
jgi:hypothetical protein